MKKLVLISFTVLTMGTFNSAVAQDVIETVLVGCETELVTYCGQVTPGEGRGLACLYAHGDKLSTQCEYALYDAATQLDRFVSGLAYLANECDEDLQTHCAAVEIGEGRLAQCLLDNKADLNDRCAVAIDATNLQVE